MSTSNHPLAGAPPRPPEHPQDDVPLIVGHPPLPGTIPPGIPEIRVTSPSIASPRNSTIAESHPAQPSPAPEPLPLQNHDEHAAEPAPVAEETWVRHSGVPYFPPPPTQAHEEEPTGVNTSQPEPPVSDHPPEQIHDVYADPQAAQPSQQTHAEDRPVEVPAGPSAASKHREFLEHNEENDDSEPLPPYTEFDEGIHGPPSAANLDSSKKHSSIPSVDGVGTGAVLGAAGGLGAAAVVEDNGPASQPIPTHVPAEDEVDESLYAPPMPPRPKQHATVGFDITGSDLPPPLPPRPQSSQQIPTDGGLTRISSTFPDDDPSNPVHYSRDPHRLIGYLVPFPKPVINGIDPDIIPTRFLIYTPPPPPLGPPVEGEKESRSIKLQRKWQNEVRAAKQSDAKLASWKGAKSRATKGISWAMGAVKSAELEFLNRVPNAPSSGKRSPSRNRPGSSGSRQEHDTHAEDGQEGSDHRTVGLEALDLIYPPSLATALPGGEEALRAEFINSMMRTRSKAQKDAVIATGLLPVTAAIDILATVIWPFGGLLEVDGVWAYASIRGAKTARSVTKRLASTTGHEAHTGDKPNEDSKETLALHFLPSSRTELLRRYLAARCIERDPYMFKTARDGSIPPTEATVLNAIGWEPSQSGEEVRNWEDEEWETQEVREDLKMVMKKAARSWEKWCKGFEKNPEKALKR